MGQQEFWHPGTPNPVTVLATVLTPKDLIKKVHCSMRIARTEGIEGHQSCDHRRIFSFFQAIHPSKHQGMRAINYQALASVRHCDKLSPQTIHFNADNNL